MSEVVDSTYISKFKTRYGMSWPKDTHDIFIDLVCAKKWREEPYKSGNLLDPWEHMLRAARALFKPTELSISPWTEIHAKDWTTEKFCIVWGCASASKSNDFGCFTVLDWITDPTETVTIMASTSKDMLLMRSYESVLRYFGILKRNPHFYIPGKQSKQKVAIINESDDDLDVTDKASIKGVAVQDGTAEQARANLQGAHLPYVRLVLDELSAMREAAMDARVNLRIGAKDFRLFGLCNPDSVYDLAGRYSTPLDGWTSVDENTGYWKTQWGSVRHHNGFKSPAILEPDGAAKYPYLINQAQIDETLREAGGNEDAPLIWTMIKGWPAPIGNHPTVLTAGSVQAFKCSEPPVWADNYVIIAGFDPAFTSGGDNPILQLMGLGYSSSNVLTLGFLDTFRLKILASKTDRPPSFQLCDQLRALQQQTGFRIQYLGVDDSGTQSVADIIEVETGIAPFRVNFAWKGSDIPVSAVNDKPAADVYRNRITEYYFTLAEHATRGQIRGLPEEAAFELCQRRINVRFPRELEAKRELKKRIKRSPDYADAAAICVGVARELFGVLPGRHSFGGANEIIAQGGDDTDYAEFARQQDVDSSKENYLTSDM